MKSIAFIGLGIMGGPMARHLLDAGYDVVGYDRGQKQLDEFVEYGGRAAANIVEAVSEADIVITMVPDSPDVEAVAYGEDGIYANAKNGCLHIDCSSIRPDVARQLNEAGHTRNIRVVDAPVSGGQSGAVEATLSIMVGGESEAVAEALPVLHQLGGTVAHVGPSGTGQTVKAANQLIVAGTIELVAEALVFLEAYGVDLEPAIKVLAGGLAGNAILQRKMVGMVGRSFEPGFRIDLHHKDMGIVTSAAREAGVAIPLGALVAQLIGSLRAQGHGQLDHTALLLQIDQLSGRSQTAARKS